MQWTVYCHTHVASGRKYIGQTRRTMSQRWSQHCYSAKNSTGARPPYFSNVISKYGRDAFTSEVLAVCSSQFEADVLERAWIERLETMNPAKGFNLKAGGNEGPASFLPEALAKMSEASRLAKAPPEVRAKISAEATARWADPVEREKQAAAIAEGKVAGYAADPTLARRIHAKRSVTMVEKNASRTHFDCKVHGPISVETNCYSKKRGAFTVYECKVCVLATQKAARDEHRAANPIAPRDHFECSIHGRVEFKDCYRRKGTNTYRCKACNLATQRAARKAAKK